MKQSGEGLPTYQLSQVLSTPWKLLLARSVSVRGNAQLFLMYSGLGFLRCATFRPANQGQLNGSNTPPPPLTTTVTVQELPIDQQKIRLNAASLSPLCPPLSANAPANYFDDCLIT